LTDQRAGSDLLLEFREAVADAFLNFELWLAFEDPDLEKFRPAFRRYSGYFAVARHAHLFTAVVSLYRLFETRPDTVNLDRLLESLEQERPGFRAGLPLDSTKVSRARAIWRKICVLRNEVFAHRNRELSVADSFGKASLSKAEVLELIDLCKRMVESIQRIWDGTAPAWPLVHTQDLEELLNMLMKHEPP